jgi:hypothetical protein
MKKRNYTQSQVISIGKAFCKKHNIVIQFVNVIPDHEDSVGVCTIKKIIICKQVNSREMASAILHEYCHMVCHRTGKYKTYHTFAIPKKNKIRHWTNFLRTGVKAEQYVDKKAEKLFPKIFPGMTYSKSYRSKASIAHFKKTFLKAIEIALMLAKLEKSEKVK